MSVLRCRGRASLFALLLLLTAPPAAPHATRLSSAQSRVQGCEVRGRLELSARCASSSVTRFAPRIRGWLQAISGAVLLLGLQWTVQRIAALI